MDRHQLWSNLPRQTVICSCTKYLCAWSGYHLVLRMILLFVLDVYRLWCFWKPLHQDLNNAETDNNTVNTKHQYCWYQSYANQLKYGTKPTWTKNKSNRRKILVKTHLGVPYDQTLLRIGSTYVGKTMMMCSSHTHYIWERMSDCVWHDFSLVNQRTENWQIHNSQFKENIADHWAK